MERNLGILGVDHIGLACRNSNLHAGFLQHLGFNPLTAQPWQPADESILAYGSGCCQIRCLQPNSDSAPSADFLTTHTDGISMIAFRVGDILTAAEILATRGACLMTDVVEVDDSHQFDITTPIGGVMFRFVQNDREQAEPSGFGGYDHFTCHFPTMAGAISWFETVMGFRQFWRFRFHTRDDCAGMDNKPGTGMNSRVMECTESGVKFALNEPLRPDFRRSQVWKFCQDHGGPGVQHVALGVHCVNSAVERLGPDRFLPTPACYYDGLADRFARFGGLGNLERMRRLGVLADAEGPGETLLQIFMRPFAAIHSDRRAGPTFFELIERRGARGFGEGNFRALFEAIERSQ